MLFENENTCRLIARSKRALRIAGSLLGAADT